MKTTSLISILSMVVLILPLFITSSFAITDNDIVHSGLNYYFEGERGSAFVDTMGNATINKNASVDIVSTNCAVGTCFSTNNAGDYLNMSKHPFSNRIGTVIAVVKMTTTAPSRSVIFNDGVDTGTNFWGFNGAGIATMRQWFTVNTAPTGTYNLVNRFACLGWATDNIKVRMYRNSTASNVTLEKYAAIDGVFAATKSPILFNDFAHDQGSTATWDEIMMFNTNVSQDKIGYVCSKLLSGNHISTTSAATPVISAVNYSGITANSAVINWTTDIASNTSVRYGTTKSLTSNNNINDAVTSHTRTLSGLSASQLYYFNVSSCTSGGCKVSGGYNFTTHTANIGTITSYYPLDNTQFNHNNITLSSVVNLVYSPTNVSFFINGQKNFTISTTSGIHNITFNRLFATARNAYNFSVQISRNGYAFNSSVHHFYVDSVSPVVQTTFKNQSIFSKYGSNFTAQFNISDMNLFSYNISVNGKQKYYQTGMTTNHTQINLTQSPSAFAFGALNNVSYHVADGHTSQALINYYQFDTNSNELDIASTVAGETKDIPLLSRDDQLIGKSLNKFVPVEEVLNQYSNLGHISINAIDGSSGDLFEVTPQEDRYTFTYTPETPRDTYQFEVTSDSELFVVNKPETLYKSWIVTSDKWVDFVLQGEPNEQISIEKTGDNTAIVTITGLEHPELLQFQSIGELNIVQKTFSFFVYANNPAKYRTSDKEISYTPLSLSINKSSHISTSVKMFYNGTLYTTTTPTVTHPYARDVWNLSLVTPSILSAKKFNVLWNYTVASDTQSISKIVPFNQTITEFNLTNCSKVYNNKPGINFSVTDLDTAQLVGNLRANGLFSIWTDPTLSALGLSKTKNFTLMYSTNSTNNQFKMCINSNRTTFVGWTMNYFTTNANYNLGLSVVSASDSSNITNRTSKNYPLGLISSTSSATISLIDKFGSPLVGYFVKVWLIRPGLNATLATSFYSDFRGNWLIQYSNIRTYRFDVYDPSKSLLLYSTGDTQIDVNPFTIQLPIKGSNTYLKSLTDINGVNGNVTCSASTKSCRFTWNDPYVPALIRYGVLRTYRVSPFGKVLINSSTQYGTVGNILYSVTENTTGYSYEGEGLLETTTTNSLYVIDRDSFDSNFSTQFFGDTPTVIFAAILLIITLALIWISLGATGVIVGTLVAVAACAFLGLIPLTLAGVIGLVCIGIAALWYARGG